MLARGVRTLVSWFQFDHHAHERVTPHGVAVRLKGDEALL